MKRMLQMSLLGLTLTGGYLAASSAFAGPGQPVDTQAMVERLTEKLGLDVKTAEEVAETLQSAREQKRAIRANVKSEAQALKSALEAGDERAMEDAMDNLEAAKSDMRALKEETADRLKSKLNTEQRAKFTLHHLRKKHRAKKGKQRTRQNAPQ